MPIRNSVSGYLSGGKSDAIWNAVKNSTARGITSVALEWGAQELDLDPFIASLSTASLTGALEGILEGRNPLEGMYDTYFKAGNGLLTLGGTGATEWEKAAYLSRVKDFSEIIKEQGIEYALETYATSFLQSETIDNIWKLGGIYDLLSNEDQIEITENDKKEKVKRIYTDLIKHDYIDLSLKDDSLVGYREGNVTFHCEFGIGKNGKPKLKTGEREEELANGSKIKVYVEKCNVVKIEERNEIGELQMTILKKNGYDSIVFGKNNKIQTAIVQMKIADKTHLVCSFEEGMLTSIEKLFDGEQILKVQNNPDIESTELNIPILRAPDPENDIPFILDKEVKNIDNDTILINAKLAFSIHEDQLADNLVDKLKEYCEVLVREKIVDSTINFFTKYKILSYLFDLTGIKDTIQSEINPTYNTITSIDSERIYNIWEEFDQTVKNGFLTAYEYTSIKYEPSLTEDMMNKAIEGAFKLIPLLGEINTGMPDKGEVVHISRFQTVDSNDYYRIVELRYNYGTFKDPSGRLREGTKYVDFKVYRAENPNDYSLSRGYFIEEHIRAPIF
ncbi:MAG: hypothetical protein KKF54_05370, partial [Candidatus Omnitrophica bacterium]|nr:hypothetical protein [Candidatus Omnitrophota bacterium]